MEDCFIFVKVCPPGPPSNVQLQVFYLSIYSWQMKKSVCENLKFFAKCSLLFNKFEKNCKQFCNFLRNFCIFYFTKFCNVVSHAFVRVDWRPCGYMSCDGPGSCVRIRSMDEEENRFFVMYRQLPGLVLN